MGIKLTGGVMKRILLLGAVSASLAAFGCSNELPTSDMSPEEEMKLMEQEMSEGGQDLAEHMKKAGMQGLPEDVQKAMGEMGMGGAGMEAELERGGAGP